MKKSWVLGDFENHERLKLAYEFSAFHSPVFIRGATATKASKAQALPKFWVTVNPISIRGANYANHITMGLVWLKFAVAPLYIGFLSRWERFQRENQYTGTPSTIVCHR